MTPELVLPFGLFITKLQTLNMPLQERIELSESFFGLIYDLELSHGVIMPESREENIRMGMQPFLTRIKQ